MINKILRIKSSYLHIISGKLHYKKKLFTGLSYVFNESGIFEKLLDVREGEVIRDSNELLFPNEKCLRLDEDTSLPLEFEEEWKEDFDVYTLDNALFEGVLYLFNVDGSIIDEEKYVDGDPVARIEWYPSGQISICSLTDRDIRWYENGQIRVEGSVGNGLAWRYTDEGLLESFTLMENKTFDIEKLLSYSLASRVELFGSGINDEVLRLFFRDDKEKNSPHSLDLCSTSVTEEMLLNIDFSGLTRLYMEHNIIITEGISAKLKNKYPSCDVILYTGIACLNIDN